MKSLSFLLTFFLFAIWAQNALAQSRTGWPACPEQGNNVEIYFEQSKGNLEYHYGYSSKQLSQMRGNAGRRLGPLWIPTGLTLADSRYQLKTGTKIYDLGYGRFCAVLAQVQLFLGYQDIDVFISNKYQRGTCEFNSILNHENTHVQIFRDTLYQHAGKIELAVRRAAVQIGPVYQRTANGAAGHIEKLLDAQIKPMFNRMQKELDVRNARIDTRENYRREQAMCSNW